MMYAEGKIRDSVLRRLFCAAQERAGEIDAWMEKPMNGVMQVVCGGIAGLALLAMIVGAALIGG